MALLLINLVHTQVKTVSQAGLFEAPKGNRGFSLGVGLPSFFGVRNHFLALGFLDGPLGQPIEFFLRS